MKTYAKKGWIALIALCVLVLGNTMTLKASVKEQKPAYTSKGLEYYVQADKKSVAVKIQNKKETVKIPESVKIRGKKYVVTEIKCTAIPHDTLVLGKKANIARDDKEYFKNTKTKTITIPKTIKKIETGAFSYYTKLTKVTVAKGNKNYKSTSQGIFSKNGKVLIYAVPGSGTYQVKAGVVKIAPRAFAGTKYSKVILPESCNEIGTRAFFKCKNLKKIQGGSLCICGDYAFFGTKVKGVDKYGTMLFAI